LVNEVELNRIEQAETSSRTPLDRHQPETRSAVPLPHPGSASLLSAPHPTVAVPPSTAGQRAHAAHHRHRTARRARSSSLGSRKIDRCMPSRYHSRVERRVPPIEARSPSHRRKTGARSSPKTLRSRRRVREIWLCASGCARGDGGPSDQMPCSWLSARQVFSSAEAALASSRIRKFASPAAAVVAVSNRACDV